MSNLSFDDVALLLHSEDDVALAMAALKRGTSIRCGALEITVQDDVPVGHKIALREIPKGAPVRKYGHIIGFATATIYPGQHVHTHNLEMGHVALDYEFSTDIRSFEPYPEGQMRYFLGYARPDGRVGTRNYIAVISSVNCSASVARFVAERFRNQEFSRKFPNVDGVIALTHRTGCTIQRGEPLEMLQRTLAGFARHPNVFGYVLIGLGCETNEVPVMVKNCKLDKATAGQPEPTIIVIKEAGGTVKTVEAAVAAVSRLLPAADSAPRSSQPISRLVMGMECGGSDANSGITGNPAMGFASDELVRYNGTSVLAETPEIYGAEHLLTRRAVSREVGEQLVALVKWWERHVNSRGASIDNNPSPGNKAGGLTNIYEKSLGAVAKAGQAPLQAVYKYAERIDSTGLCFMDTPGYDPVSMTGLAAGGCNIAVFVTGRGSVYGCKPVPCIKVATNTPMFERLSDDMDINAGTILEGKESVADVGRRIFEKLIAVASGEKTKSELHGMGEEEFAPWDIGTVL